MAGWKLVSVQGNQTYTLKARATIKVTSGPNALANSYNLKWTTANIWLNSGDLEKLYDSKGVLVHGIN